MPNDEREGCEGNARWERMLAAGFRAFSERSIESVTLQEVADASEVGIATLYRYFQTKAHLVLAIATRKWEEYYQEVEANYQRLGGEWMNAAEELDFYLGAYITLYREHRDILRFNQDFNGYILNAGLSEEEFTPYRAAADAFARKFHLLYEKGKRDGTIRTDLPEGKMFLATMHIMLAVSARFAQGVVYRVEEEDLTQELLGLKRSLLRDFVIPRPSEDR